MKSKLSPLLLLLSSLSVFSWLILIEAHPLVKDTSDLTDALEFSSNELPKDEITYSGKEPVTRNKRTIGFLRQLFPGISQIIDRKIQQITRILFRVVGRVILRGGNGNADGGGGGSGGGDGGRKISITLPTYPPFEDEEEETNAPGTESSSTLASTPDSNSGVQGIENKPEQANEIASTNSGTSWASNTEVPPSSNIDATNLPDTSNTIIRKSRDISDVLSDTTLPDDLQIIDSPSSTESLTTKRAGLLWRLGRGKRGSVLGNSSGTGNFIFDLVRLVAGSGTSPEKDEEQNAPRDTREDDPSGLDDVNEGVTSSSLNPEDDTSDIPGPLTRFALLVNRGISNVVKDLILLCPSEEPKHLQEQRSKLLTTVVNNAL